MNRLIMLEGIPGSGKTTYARRLAEYFIENGLPAKCYLEGDSHPADLAWCAVLTDGEYIELLGDYPDYSEKIEDISYVESNRHMVPYLSLGIKAEHQTLREFLESREIFNGKYSIDNFLKINLSRWTTFSKQFTAEDKIIIFESVFMQNHLNEIILFNDYTYELLFEYIDNFKKAVLPLEPLLIYLDQNDIRKTIEEVSMKRKSPDEGSPGWIDHVVSYVGNSPFGKKCRKTGIDCFFEFLEIRKSMEHKLFNDLDIKKLMVLDSSRNYNKGFDDIITFLEKTNPPIWKEEQRTQ